MQQASSRKNTRDMGVRAGCGAERQAPDLHARVIPSPYLTQRHVGAPWYRGNARIPLTSS